MRWCSSSRARTRSSLGLAYHLPQSLRNDNAVGFVGSQLGTSSLGLSQDALSGLAFGVFGETVPVPVLDPTTGLAIHSGGARLRHRAQRDQDSGSTNIISNPNADRPSTTRKPRSWSVGRSRSRRPSGLNNLGQPVVSFQREDVAITMKMTPRINSSNYVTLELEVEVQEVEESAQSAATSPRPAAASSPASAVSRPWLWSVTTRPW